MSSVYYRLLNCLQEDGKLFLVFEFVDKDLKRFMEHKLGNLELAMVKVSSLPVYYECVKTHCINILSRIESFVSIIKRSCIFPLKRYHASVRSSSNTSIHCIL
jgi:hypothetical protein